MGRQLTVFPENDLFSVESCMTYQIFPDIYDIENKHWTVDIPFWVELAQKCGSPVLEFGCGTGRILLPIARTRISIIGLDNNQLMLKLAKDKLKLEKPYVTQFVSSVLADICNFSLDQKYSLVIIGYNLFFLLGNRICQKKVLERANYHLELGGCLAIDIVEPNFQRILTKPSEVRKLDLVVNNGQIPELVLHRYRSSNYDQVLNKWMFRFDYEIMEMEKVSYRSRNLCMQLLHKDEMVALLEEFGFKTIKLSSGYTNIERFNEDRMIIIAEKTKDVQ